MEITSDPDEKTSSKPTHGVRANRGDISEVRAFSTRGWFIKGLLADWRKPVGRQGQRRHGGDGGGGGGDDRGRTWRTDERRLFLSFFSRRPEP